MQYSSCVHCFVGVFHFPCETSCYPYQLYKFEPAKPLTLRPHPHLSLLSYFLLIAKMHSMHSFLCAQLRFLRNALNFDICK